MGEAIPCYYFFVCLEYQDEKTSLSSFQEEQKSPRPRKKEQPKAPSECAWELVTKLEQPICSCQFIKSCKCRHSNTYHITHNHQILSTNPNNKISRFQAFKEASNRKSMQYIHIYTCMTHLSNRTCTSASKMIQQGSHYALSLDMPLIVITKLAIFLNI